MADSSSSMPHPDQAPSSSTVDATSSVTVDEKETKQPFQRPRQRRKLDSSFRPTCSIVHSSSTGYVSRRKPLAPSLAAYRDQETLVADGNGAPRFRPRPEWLLAVHDDDDPESRMMWRTDEDQLVRIVTATTTTGTGDRRRRRRRPGEEHLRLLYHPTDYHHHQQHPDDNNGNNNSLEYCAVSQFQRMVEQGALRHFPTIEISSQQHQQSKRSRGRSKRSATTSSTRAASVAADAVTGAAADAAENESSTASAPSRQQPAAHDQDDPRHHHHHLVCHENLLTALPPPSSSSRSSQRCASSSASSSSSISRLQLEQLQQFEQQQQHKLIPVRFGSDWDCALATAIRRDFPTSCIVTLIRAIAESSNSSASSSAVNALNVKGFTPLLWAAQKGNLEIVQELCKAVSTTTGSNAKATNSKNSDEGDDNDSSLMTVLTTTTHTGVTTIMQAAHFGHAHIVEWLLATAAASHPDVDNNNILESGAHISGDTRNSNNNNNDNRATHLVEQANLNETTPLMRAAQEGHRRVVQVLLAWGAQVNRRNQSLLTPLMLASQRGHASIVNMLLQAGADVDAVTGINNSTALHLAVKRNHSDVVQLLVQAGCELWIRDGRGRTARDLALLRYNRDDANHTNADITQPVPPQPPKLIRWLNSETQVRLMQHQSRLRRSYEIARCWQLLQLDRANYFLISRSSSTEALVRTMTTLPSPLVRMVAQFMPYPHIWDVRIGMLTKRAVVDSNAAVASCLDLVDEVLEEGGFCEACDAARLPPPEMPRASGAAASATESKVFSSWAEWKSFGRKHGVMSSSDDSGSSDSTTAPGVRRRRRRQRRSVTVARIPSPTFGFGAGSPFSLTEFRRHAKFLPMLAKSDALAQVLTLPPYRIPPGIVQKLVTCSDVVSLSRRMQSGITFDAHVAMDFVMLISQLCSWYWCRDSVIPSYLDIGNAGFTI